MFGYVVKRLLTGLLVVALVSMMVYALFWYGPKSPAKPICDADRNNARDAPPRSSRGTRSASGYNNPIAEEYAKWVKGLFVGREIDFGSTTFDCPAPCLGTSFITATAGVGGAEGAVAGHAQHRHRRSHPLPPRRRDVGIAAARRRGYLRRQVRSSAAHSS